MLGKIINNIFLAIMKRNEFESLQLRKYFKKKYSIDVGLYSYGCFDANRIPKNTKIGRYCSFSPTAYIFSRNHGLEFMSLHACLYNSSLGFFDGEDRAKETVCTVGDDVWFGHNSIITPSVSRIGRGAVIAAGAVVTKNVPPYVIVGGNPAKVIRYRFTERTIGLIEESRWWLMSKEEFKNYIKYNQSFAYEPDKENF